MSNSIFLPLIDNGHGSIKANFLISILRGFKDRDIHIDRFSDSLPSRARNRAAAHFLRETKRDYIMFIDSDIIFDDHHIAFLMESDEPILAGIYCKKSKGIEPCINTLPGAPAETLCGGYVEIARAGTGFLRIHRSVLEKMKDCGEENPNWAKHYVNHGADEWDFFSVGVVNKEYLSEDWYFCDKARALGFKVMLDTRIQVRHEGSAIFPLDEVIEKVNAAHPPPVEQAPLDIDVAKPSTDVEDYDLRDLDGDLGLLDDRRRGILVARFFEGKTLKEVAEQFGISSPRVRQLEQSAMDKIRRLHKLEDIALQRMVTPSN